MTIPITLYKIPKSNYQILINVTIMGDSQLALIDTGASVTVLSTEMAIKYGLAILDIEDDALSFSGTLDAKKTLLKLTIGSSEVDNIEAAVISFEHLKPIYFNSEFKMFDLILGADVLNRLKMTIDLENLTLAW
jgi:predicted aspartyl protease